MDRDNSMIKNEQIMIETSRDKMYGIIAYVEPQNGGKLLDLGTVNEQLKSKGIVFGIDDEAIKDSMKNKQYHYKYIVAKGEKPVAGEAAKLTYHFDHENIGKRQPKTKADGTVDFKELGLVVNTAEGTVLVTKQPATEGKNGCNVLGQAIVAVKGKDFRMPRGKNTELSADGLQIIAKIDGQLAYDGQSVSVSPHYIIQTDVDSSVGNVDFVGNIVINGGVHSGYTIRSKGNIEVRGPVEAATIIADGDIILWYGIQGGDKGQLIAKGNIITKFIQNAIVHADGDVVTEAIMHSEVAAGGNVRVDNGKGLVVGGSITAGKGIYTNTLGSPMATVTAVQLGIAPRIVEEYKLVEHKYAELKEKSFKTDQNVSYLKLKGIGGLSADKKALLDKILILQDQLKVELEQTQARYFELKDGMKDIDGGIIKVRNTVYPGVRVTIGNAVKFFVEKAPFCSITKEAGEISIGLY